MIHTKNKIVIGLSIIAFTILLALGLLFYTLSDKGISTSLNSNKGLPEFSNTKAEAPTETKDEPHFNIFSILSRFISN